MNMPPTNFNLRGIKIRRFIIDIFITRSVEFDFLMSKGDIKLKDNEALIDINVGFYDIIMT